MIAGGRLLAPDGKQVSVFPALTISTTQGAGGGESHQCNYASDNASPVGKKVLYAPCDMKLIYKDNNWNNGYTCFFHTVEPVYTPRLGLTHYTMTLTHADDISWLVEGKTYKQGQHIYDEGNSGASLGTHVHINVAQGHHTTLVNPACPESPYPQWQLQGGTYIDNIFFKNMTEVIQENTVPIYQGWRKYDFLEYEGGTNPDPDPDPDPDPEPENSDILVAMMCRALPDFF